MQTRWNNIIALILLIVVLVVLGKNWPAIYAALTSIRYIGPSHSPEDKAFGVVVLGIICLLIVAIVKILTTRGRQ